MAIQTMIRSAFMRRMTSERAEVRAIKKGRKQRDNSGRPVIHYFHGVADPFSALAVQTLTTLADAYNVDIRCHIASGAQGDYIGDGERFDRWAFQDASDIASFYGLAWPAPGTVATPSEFADALSALSSAGTTLDFVSAAVRVFDSVASAAREDSNSASESDSRAKITDQWIAFERGDAVAAGNKLRKSLGHYGAGMFYFEGQWYWGLDRLRVLERRLIAEGLASDEPRGHLPRAQCRSVARPHIVRRRVGIFPVTEKPLYSHWPCSCIGPDRAVERSGQREGCHAHDDARCPSADRERSSDND